MISIIIPTYNEENYIEKCLKSLSNQTLPRNKYEIIIVDGGSKDRTIDIARKYVDKVIRQKSKGVGGARNDGVNAAKYGVIATTDADVIVPDNWLERIVKRFKSKDTVFVSGSVFYRGDNIYLNIFYHLFDLFVTFLYFIVSPFGLIPSIGANMSFKKDTFLNINGFKSIPVMDDFELHIRIKKLGKCIFIPTLAVSASDRRFRKYGFIKTNLSWLYNGLRVIFKQDVQKINYSKQNYG